MKNLYFFLSFLTLSFFSFQSKGQVCSPDLTPAECSIALHTFTLTPSPSGTAIINDVTTACESGTSGVINVTAGASYDFMLTVNTASGSDFNCAYYSIWIDKNNDNDFSDAGEQLFLEDSTPICKIDHGSPNSGTGTITIPADVLTGTNLTFRVLVTLDGDSGGGTGCSYIPTDACGVYCEGGEFHDYIFNVSAPACTPPADPTNARLNFDACTVPSSYPVQFCENQQIYLVANCPAGSTAQWYMSSAGGIAVATGTTASTCGINQFAQITPSIGLTTYYVSCLNTCESNRVSAGSVNIIAKPAAPTTGSPFGVCGGDCITLTATCASGSSVVWKNEFEDVITFPQCLSPSTKTTYNFKAYCKLDASPFCLSNAATQEVTAEATVQTPTNVTATPATICEGKSTVLSASGCTGTNEQLSWFDSATGGSFLGLGNNLSQNPTTSTTYYVECANSDILCSSSRASVSVTVNSTPSSPNGITGPNYICSGNTVSLTAVGCMGDVTWYGSNTSTAVLATTNPFTTEPLNSNTTYFVACTNTTTGCESSRQSKFITVYSTPAAPTASGVSICSGATADLTATCPTGTVNWYNALSGGTLLSSGANYTTSTLTTNTTYYAGCETGDEAIRCHSTRTAVLVTVNENPTTPNVSSPVNYCQNATATALSATASGGNTLLWYGTNSTGGTSSTTAPTPLTTSFGTTNYYVSQLNSNNCESPRAEITVNVNPTPPTPTDLTASPNPICASSSTDISIRFEQCFGTVKWYSGSSFATFVGDGSGINGSLSVSPTSTTDYKAKCVTETCESPLSSETLTVTVENPTAPSVTSPVNYCQNATATALSATASSGNTLLWYGQNSTGGTSSTATPIPSTSSVGPTKYYVSQITTSGCESPRAEITVNINANPTAPSVTSPVNYCEGATTTPLSATASSGNTLLWYGQNSTGGTFSTTVPIPPTTNLSNTTAVILNYWVSQKVNATGCESSRSQIIVNINPRPIPPIVSSITYCQEDIPFALFATPGVNQTIFWYGTNSTGGIASTIAPIPSTLTTGITQYYAAQRFNITGCESNRAVLTVTINPKPPQPTINNISYCQNSISTPLTASVLSNHTLNWYSNSTGWIGSTEAPTPSTTNVGNFNYYVAQRSDPTGCESNRSVIVVTIYQTPNQPTGTSNSTICNNSTASLSATCSSGTVKWFDGGGSTLLFTGSPFITPNLTANTNYKVRCELGSCTSAFADVAVTISTATPTASNTGPYEANQTIMLSATGGTSYSWAGPNGFTATGSNVSRIGAVPSMAGVYTVTVSNSIGCSATATTSVVISECQICFNMVTSEAEDSKGLFELKNGMQFYEILTPTETGIVITLAPNLSSVTESVRIVTSGPINFDITESIQPYTSFENRGRWIFGLHFVPGVYTVTITGYSLDNLGGTITIPATTITFTVLPRPQNLAINLTSSVPPSVCLGNTIPVTFTTTGTFGESNQFQILLLNDDGTYKSPRVIGLVNNAGTYNITLPNDIDGGIPHIIRVLSTNGITASNNSSAFVLGASNLNLISPIDDVSTTQADKIGGKITATNMITGAGKINYKAQQSVILNAGFKADSGTVFVAQISGCN